MYWCILNNLIVPLVEGLSFAVQNDPGYMKSESFSVLDANLILIIEPTQLVSSKPSNA